MKLEELEGFVWDTGNREKNIAKHGVSNSESEEVFFNFNLVLENGKHSRTEARYRLLGKTNEGRVLFLVFTTRGNKARIISARMANKKEKHTYHEAFKKSTKIQD